MSYPTHRIEPYRPEDRAAVEAVCIATGLRGKLDELFCDRPLFAKLWLAPYLDGQPQNARVVRDEDGKIVGYLAAFIGPGYRRSVLRHSLPHLLTLLFRAATGRYRHHPPSLRFVRWLFLNSWRECPPTPKDTPAHFHFNILPEARGIAGIELYATFEKMVRAAGLPGWYAIIFSSPPHRNRDLFGRRFGLHVVEMRRCSLYPDESYVALLAKRFAEAEFGLRSSGFGLRGVRAGARDRAGASPAPTHIGFVRQNGSCQQTTVCRGGACPRPIPCPRPNPPKPEARTPKPELTTVAVVIPAHNEKDYIGPLLASLLAQTEAVDEVVVVCDNCTDDTDGRARGVFAAFPSSVCCRTLRVSLGDIAAVRNAGIRATESDIVICLDADTIAHPTMTARVRRAVAGGAFYGGFGMIPDGRFRRKIGQAMMNAMWLNGVMLAERFLGNFIGSGVFFRRTEGLLFDEAWGWAEDIEFSGRARRLARQREQTWAYLGDAPLVYCDRRFIENGYVQEIRARLTKGVGHLRREAARRDRREKAIAP